MAEITTQNQAKYYDFTIFANKASAETSLEDRFDVIASSVGNDIQHYKTLSITQVEATFLNSNGKGLLVFSLLLQA